MENMHTSDENYLILHSLEDIVGNLYGRHGQR